MTSSNMSGEIFPISGRSTPVAVTLAFIFSSKSAGVRKQCVAAGAVTNRAFPPQALSPQVQGVGTALQAKPSQPFQLPQALSDIVYHFVPGMSNTLRAPDPSRGAVIKNTLLAGHHQLYNQFYAGLGIHENRGIRMRSTLLIAGLLLCTLNSCGSDKPTPSPQTPEGTWDLIGYCDHGVSGTTTRPPLART